jgi:hypothetical protein
VQLDSGQAPCGKLDRSRRDIDADDVDTSIERAAKERPGATSDVEHARAGRGLGQIEHPVEERRRVRVELEIGAVLLVPRVVRD